MCSVQAIKLLGLKDRYGVDDELIERLWNENAFCPIPKHVTQGQNVEIEFIDDTSEIQTAVGFYVLGRGVFSPEVGSLVPYNNIISWRKSKIWRR